MKIAPMLTRIYTLSLLFFAGVTAHAQNPQLFHLRNSKGLLEQTSAFQDSPYRLLRFQTDYNPTSWGEFSHMNSHLRLSLGNTFDVYTNNLFRMSIDSAGRFRFAGLSNNNVQNRFLVADTNGYLFYRDISSITGNSWLQGGNSFGTTGVLGTLDNNHLDFYTNNTQQLRLTNSGNLLLGTTNDNARKLQVVGAAWIGNSTNSGGILLNPVQSINTEKIIIGGLINPGDGQNSIISVQESDAVTPAGLIVARNGYLGLGVSGANPLTGWVVANPPLGIFPGGIVNVRTNDFTFGTAPGPYNSSRVVLGVSNINEWLNGSSGPTVYPTRQNYYYFESQLQTPYDTSMVRAPFKFGGRELHFMTGNVIDAEAGMFSTPGNFILGTTNDNLIGKLQVHGQETIDSLYDGTASDSVVVWNSTTKALKKISQANFLSNGGGSGLAWLQGGNSFGSTGVLGTMDNQNLVFKANGLQSGLIDVVNFNTAFGQLALFSNTTGVFNTAVGRGALAYSVTGSNNTAVGIYALVNNAGGSYNNAFGRQTLGNNTTGIFNTADGYQNMFNNSTGSNNASFGFQSLYSNTTGSNNTTSGYTTGFNITTGNNNTLIGSATGMGLTVGNNNTILGANVTGLPNALNNNIIIADGQGNRRINIDSTGKVGIGTISPTAQLHTTGTVRFAGLTSDSTKNRFLVSDSSGNLYYRNLTGFSGNSSANFAATGGDQLATTDRYFNTSNHNFTFDSAGNFRITNLNGEFSVNTTDTYDSVVTTISANPYSRGAINISSHSNNFANRIQLDDFSSGVSAGAGLLFHNDIGHAFQLYFGSSTNGFQPDGTVIRNVYGQAGMRFTTDAGRFSFQPHPLTYSFDSSGIVFWIDSAGIMLTQRPYVALDTTNYKLPVYGPDGRFYTTNWPVFGNSNGGTVTNVGSGYGLTGGPIVTTGTISADTTKLIPYTDTLKSGGMATQTYVLNHGANASNGLTLLNNNITLGGTLNSNTVINTTANYGLTLTGNSSSPTLQVTNTSSGTAVNINSTSGIALNATGNIYGVLGSGSSVAGVGGISDGSFGGIYGQSSIGRPGLFNLISPADSNSGLPVIELWRQIVQGHIPSNGIGGSIDFKTSSSSYSLQVSSRILSKWTDVNDATRTGQLEFWTTNSGASARKAAIAGNGNITFDSYPNTRNDGSTSSALYVDASGNLKYGPISGVGGSGTVTNVATTNGYGITSSVVNPGTTPNITIGIDTTKLVPYTDTLKSNGMASKTFVSSQGYLKAAVTSVATGYGLTGGTITGTGTVVADTTKLVPYTDTAKAGGIATQTYVLSHAGTGTVTNVSTTNGYAVTSSISNPGTTPNITIGIDTTKLVPYTDTLKSNGMASKTFVSSQGYLKAAVTSVATGYGLTGGTITGTGTVVADTTKLVPYTDTAKAGGIATQSYVNSHNYWTLNGTNLYKNSGTNTGVGTTAPLSTLDVAGSVAGNMVTVSANYTVLATDYTIYVTNGATAVTITLPAASGATRRIYNIARGTSSTGTITIATAGGSVEALSGTLGTTTTVAALGSYGSKITFQSNGTNYVRIGN
ncbi:MAG TPA: hypothetical protein VMT76_01825 [Puia sp.]|nr:hypothetical protein [Puia sp.]